MTKLMVGLLRNSALALFAVAAGLLAACTSSSTDTTRAPANIAIVSGSGQTGQAGVALSQPLVVKVTAADGTPVAGVTVDFTVTSGQATLSPASAVTDATGVTQTQVTLGSSSGTVEITAAVRETLLRATATALVQAVSTNPGCTAANTVSLAVGETRTALTGSSICLSNNTAGEYLVHAFFGSTVQSGQTQIGITGNGIVASGTSPAISASAIRASEIGGLGTLSLRSVAPGANDPARQLDLRLRRLERAVLAPRMAAARAALRGRGALRAAAAPNVGQLLQFNVDEDCTKTARPNIRTGRVAAVTSTTIVVADTLNPAGGFTDADYQSVGVTFDTLVNQVDVAAFGAPSDIDANSRVILFYTSVVNAMTPAKSQSVVEGFFNPRDLFPTTLKVLTPTDTLAPCTASNVAEMFYLIVPDPNGTINTNVRSKADVQQFTIATTVHEYQHLINAARRLYVNSADDFEEVWLNEGLSHIAEELLYYREGGVTPRQNIDGTSIRSSAARVDAFNNVQINNFDRYGQFLENPSGNSPYADNDSLATRGATWSFLRYAADHLGTGDGTTWQQLVNSKTSGFQNLANVFGGTIINEFRDWAISVYTDDLVGTTAAYQQPSWNDRSIYQTAFRSSFPYPLVVTALTNGVQKSATVVAGGSLYTKIGVAAGTTASASWSVTSPNVQISIVRTK